MINLMTFYPFDSFQLQELEKQMKAKQFQHLAVHTTVQPFSVDDDENSTNMQEIKEITPSPEGN